MSLFLLDISSFSINPLYTAQLTTLTSPMISIDFTERVIGCAAKLFIYLCPAKLQQWATVAQPDCCGLQVLLCCPLVLKNKHLSQSIIVDVNGDSSLESRLCKLSTSSVALFMRLCSKYWENWFFSIILCNIHPAVNIKLLLTWGWLSTVADLIDKTFWVYLCLAAFFFSWAVLQPCTHTNFS